MTVCLEGKGCYAPGLCWKALSLLVVTIILMITVPQAAWHVLSDM